MSGALAIAGEISGAAAALAGLILVFFAAALSSFDSYSETQKASVRWSYRLRAWPAFLAMVVSLASCGLALHAKAASSTCSATVAIWLLGMAGVGVLVSAVAAMRDIG